jgi:hypothetical protein
VIPLATPDSIDHRPKKLAHTCFGRSGGHTGFIQKHNPGTSITTSLTEFTARTLKQTVAVLFPGDELADVPDGP